MLRHRYNLLPQLRRYTSKTVLQSHFDINGVKPLLWITFPFPNAAVGPADRWPAWHMKHISPLIFFGTVWSRPTAAAVKWGRDSLSKANKFSLCLVYTKLCEPFRATWEEIRWLGTLLASENYITKNVYLSLPLSACLGVGLSLASANVPPFPSNCTRWTPTSGTPVGHNSIITTLFPKEMMCFLTWATWDWTLVLRTGNWKNKHTHPAMQCTFNKCLQVNIARKMCQNHNNFATHTQPASPNSSLFGTKVGFSIP